MLSLWAAIVWFPCLVVLAVMFAVIESGFGGRYPSSYRRMSSLICCWRHFQSSAFWTRDPFAKRNGSGSLVLLTSLKSSGMLPDTCKYSNFWAFGNTYMMPPWSKILLVYKRHRQKLVLESISLTSSLDVECLTLGSISPRNKVLRGLVLRKNFKIVFDFQTLALSAKLTETWSTYCTL